jgi:hypothetical protein
MNECKNCLSCSSCDQRKSDPDVLFCSQWKPKKYIFRQAKFDQDEIEILNEIESEIWHKILGIVKRKQNG